MNRWIDTHAHYGHKRFGKQDYLNSEREYVEYIVQVGTNEQSNIQTLKLIDKYDFLYGAVGFFPTDAWVLDHDYSAVASQTFDTLCNQLKHPKVVALGEIGLDYNWDCLSNGVKGTKARESQRKTFIQQLELAKAFGLPVSIHSRDAEEDTIEIFDRYQKIHGVIHCFSYGVDTAQIAITKGLYLGIGGTSTYPSNQELRDVIAITPIEKIVLETDAPYLSPQPVRREVNTSTNIKYVIENIAQIKHMNFDDVVNITNQNAKTLFNFNKEK